VAALASPVADAPIAIRCQVCATKIVVPGPDEIVVKNAILRVDCASGRVTTL
jgi:hypothetical protein